MSQRDRMGWGKIRQMSRAKIVTVFGTRPDAIKMAPVVKELQRRSDVFDLKICVTGQHREMLDQVLKAFSITPDHDLAIMQQGQTLAQITTRALNGLDSYFSEIAPDFVVAQGDTSTTLVAALAAFYHRAGFGHVEAGLRTGDKWNPYPEEMNRLLTTRLTTLHFPPTKESANHLLREGVDPKTIVITGNTVIDALLAVANSPFDIKDFPSDPALPEILASGKRVILVTAHRRENWGEPMAQICQAVKILVERYPDVLVAFAMHRNPVVRETILPILGNVDRVKLIEPPDYVPFVKLEQKATVILTDSGGVQEEAPSLGKPVLVLRETTERPEGVDAGTAKLVGTKTDVIVEEASRLLSDKNAYDSMAKAVSPYGDGKAAARIVDTIADYVKTSQTANR
jgi:UDP-N-acetylglucosamine 2-epimerase (non-hydrolysing)